ncbi:hypothetical protein [Cutibacterium avidum]|uniref:hypothetical protein n=1 Tax=Cutibacterium avidum TaxID=33010 RepID=UPI0008100CB0|nr:hypothetical protein [Cutibacterium avidum]OCK13485.1 hypothetical protein A9G02_11415 [Cutibacterium avidum]
MSARDDLADLIEVADANTWDKTTPVPNWQQIADAVLAAGWRPPARKIETVEELDALPLGTAVQTPNGAVFVADWRSEGALIWLVSEGDGWTSEEMELPATVLWEPGDDDE